MTFLAFQNDIFTDKNQGFGFFEKKRSNTSGYRRCRINNLQIYEKMSN